MNLRVLDAHGHEIRRGRDLDGLRRELRGPAARAARPDASHGWERSGLRRWEFGELPTELLVTSGGVSLRMFPGLEDAGSAVRLRLFPTRAAAQAATPQGVVRLAALAMPQQHELVRRQCAADRELALLTAAAGLDRGLFAEVADRAGAEALRLETAGVPRDETEFAGRVEAGRAEVAAAGEQAARWVKAVLLAVKEVRAALEPLAGPAFAAGHDSIRRHLDTLLAPGWVRRTPPEIVAQLPKYLRAAARRAQRLRDNVARDRRLDTEVAPYESTYQLFSLQGLPDRLTTSVTVDRMEIGTQSLQLVKQRQRHTHEPIINPYSPEFATLSAPPPVQAQADPHAPICGIGAVA